MSMLSESEARAKAGAQFATGTGRHWLGEFEVFILRGNVVDLAIGVVIGVAFGAVVTALVQDVLMPIIGIFGGKPTFDQYYWVINNSEIKVGSFLTTLVSFLIVAAVIFFFVLKPVNVLMDLRKTEKSVQKTTRDCPYCLSSIPLQATRCAFCTQAVPAMVAVTADAKVEA